MSLNIALVAHDSRKSELIEWITYNLNELMNHTLYATGTTGKLIKNIRIECNIESDKTLQKMRQIAYPLENNVICLHSGPLGGDQQIGAMIAEGKVDVLIFFCDNLITQGHQQDVEALSRLASLYNIPFATNRTTADMILTSSLFDNPDYQRIIPPSIENYANRQLRNI